MSEYDDNVNSPKDGEVETVNYMTAPADLQDIQLCEAIVADSLVSDPSINITNQQKWEHVKKTFKAPPDTTLFARISYESVYDTDDPVKCEATAFVADLRIQYLEKRLEKEFSPTLHGLYLANIQWMVKLRERARMKGLQQMLKGVILH